METELLTKAELKKQIKRFIEDKDRGISIAHFCEIAGIGPRYFLDIFYYGKHPLSEMFQIRVNKAYQDWKAGKLVVMRRADRTRYVDYRREPKPPIRPEMGLKMTSEGLKLRVGMVNRHDYSRPDLDEALRG